MFDSICNLTECQSPCLSGKSSRTLPSTWAMWGKRIIDHHTLSSCQTLFPFIPLLPFLRHWQILMYPFFSRKDLRDTVLVSSTFLHIDYKVCELLVAELFHPSREDDLVWEVKAVRTSFSSLSSDKFNAIVWCTYHLSSPADKTLQTIDACICVQWSHLQMDSPVHKMFLFLLMSFDCIQISSM